MTVDQLMKAIAALPPEELFQLQDRLEEHLAEMWRRRMAEISARRTEPVPYHSPIEPGPQPL